MKKSNRRTAEFVFDGRNVAPPSFKPTPQSWREASLRSSVVLFPFVILKVSFFFFCFCFSWSSHSESLHPLPQPGQEVTAESLRLSFLFPGRWLKGSHPNKLSLPHSCRPGSRSTSIHFRVSLIPFRFPHTKKKSQYSIYTIICQTVNRHIWYLRAVNLTHLVHFSTLKQMQGNVIQGFLNTEASNGHGSNVILPPFFHDNTVCTHELH